jgi:hypothetical protein
MWAGAGLDTREQPANIFGDFSGTLGSVRGLLVPVCSQARTDANRKKPLFHGVDFLVGVAGFEPATTP